MAQYETLGNAIDSYKNSLVAGADWFEIDDVDKVDFYYESGFKNILGSEAGVFSPLDTIGGEANMFGGGQSSDKIFVDKNTYFDRVNPPAYLRNFFTPATTESAASAYSNISNLQNPSDIASVLSNYYGYEITPTEQNLGRFGGNRQLYTG